MLCFVLELEDVTLIEIVILYVMESLQNYH